MQLTINGQAREFAEIHDGSTVADLVAVLAMQADRVALERNGELVSRAAWAETAVQAGDRLEIVHFVGGGNFDGTGAFTWSKHQQTLNWDRSERNAR